MFANSSYRLGKLGGEARRNGGQALSIEGRSKWETGSKSIRSCTKSLRIFEMEVPCCECSGMHHVTDPGQPVMADGLLYQPDTERSSRRSVPSDTAPPPGTRRAVRQPIFDTVHV